MPLYNLLTVYLHVGQMKWYFCQYRATAGSVFASDHQSVLDYDQIIFLTKNQKKICSSCIVSIRISKYINLKTSYAPILWKGRIEMRLFEFIKCRCIHFGAVSFLLVNK